jgi:UPF0042 nucleotide-binding protein
MKSFEDLGFYCVDNLPPALTIDLVTLAERAGLAHVALSLDVRVHGPFGEAETALAELASRTAHDVLFLEANDEAIVRRYSETRRRHPGDGPEQRGLTEAIARERAELAPLRARATLVWDTTHLTQSTLKRRIVAAFATDLAKAPLAVRVVAFGFKHGIPMDADLVFDVRFFENPNYVPELKDQTGCDAGVVDFMEGLPETEPFLAHLFGTIDYLVPLYVGEGKSRLTIAIGCTGGRHRSVYVANRLAAHLAARHPAIVVSTDYRELAAV